MDIAVLLRNGQTAKLASMGYSESTARWFVMKRRRNLAGKFIGDSVRELLGGTINRTDAAVRYVTEHGMTANAAAVLTDIDERNLRRVVRARQRAIGGGAGRRAKSAKRTKVKS